LNFECALSAAYLINRTPSTILHEKTLYEVLFGAKPTYDRIKIFGHLCYAHKLHRQKDKLGPRSRKCVFIGYPCGKKEWKIYDIESFVTQDIIFCEEAFPFTKEIRGQDENHIEQQALPINNFVEVLEI